MVKRKGVERRGKLVKCPQCGRSFRQPRFGRKRETCRNACRVARWRQRQAAAVTR